MKMGWRNAGVVFLIVYLFVAQGNASVQYINTNFRGNCPCQNVPVQRNLPIRIPLSANLPITNNWVPNIPPNNIALPSSCNCNANNRPIPNERLRPEERTKLIANLKMVLSNLLPIAEKLAQLSNLALATRNVASPAANLNVPMRKLNVPIVNDVPFGALRVARNLPLSNFLAENGVSNNMKVLGKGPVNYQNVAGTPLNTVARLALNNLRSLPLSNLLNSVPNVPINNYLNGVPNVPINNFLNGVPNVPINNFLNGVPNVPINNFLNGVPNVPINNFLNGVPNVPINNFLNGVPNAPISNLLNSGPNTLLNPGYSVNNVLNNNIERRSILSQPPCNNIPCNNVPAMTLNNILEKIQMARNLNLPVNNSPLPINNQIRVNTVSNPINYNQPVQNTIRYINTASPPVINNRFTYEQILGSSNTGRITNVPVIPSQTLAELPAYNGLPVIKVSESVYRLTPIDNVL